MAETYTSLTATSPSTKTLADILQKIPQNLYRPQENKKNIV